jgi:hypothetical protein
MPSDYIAELADQAYAKITPEAWKNSEEICAYLPEKPATVLELAQDLESQPALQAQIAWHIGYTPSQWLVENELDQIHARRLGQGIDGIESKGETYLRAAQSGLMGICLSGGGIRSATFNLGVLQGLAELNLLRCFDYLSSVSGGGYIHQWLAAWIRRESDKNPTTQVQGFDIVNRMLIPPPEPDNMGEHAEPIRWLRQSSNYLTPQRGPLTADTWVAIATWLRNTILNQIILIAGLLFLVLLPHILTFQSLLPQRDWAVLICTGVIIYLFLVATVFIGENLAQINAGPSEIFGQPGVQVFLVIPLLAAGILTTFLFPISLLGIDLGWSFLLATALQLTLAATVTFKGGAPLSFLKSHHRTAHFGSFSEFWKQKPKCFAHVKAAFAILGLCFIAVFAALCGAFWNLLATLIMAWLWSYRPSHGWELALVIGPPLALGGPVMTLLVVVGLLGRSFSDARREWLSRFAAWMGLYALTWLFFVGFSLFSHAAVIGLSGYVKTKTGILIGWAGTTLASLLAAKSSSTKGATADKASPKLNVLEVLALVGPYVFIAGLLLIISCMADIFFVTSESYGTVWVVLAFVAPLVVCALFAWRVDINEFSLHAFYRNRLTRCYLGASNTSRRPNPFSGFDEGDANIAVSDLLPHKGYYGPYPIFCTALNLTHGEDLAWQERKAASFVFTPLYSGYDVGWTAAKNSRKAMRFNGFVQTETYAYPAPGIHINTAAAISGAALSPNSGFHSSPATAFLLTVFNVRLGWWLANPRVLAENGEKLDGRRGKLTNPYPRPSPHFSLFQLVSELLGAVDDTSRYVMLSDGGHFDNMGIYELVRRRCRYIVICDAEEDRDLKLEGVGMAIRKCRIDFGAEIDLDLRPFQHPDETGYSAAHCVVGTITYPETPNDPGMVVYLKASLTGDESGDILNYKKEDPPFPYDSTMNQWFTESQFESYRRLGHHAAMATFQPGRPISLQCGRREQRSQYFENLKNIWCPLTPEMQRYSPNHSLLFQSLLQEVRTDPKLAGLFDMLFDRDPNHALDWKTTHAQDADYCMRFCSKLIEFIFIVYMQLRLVFPENLTHPFAEGWLEIFRNWSRIDVLRDAWLRYGPGYSKAFQIFAESNKVGLPKH